MFGPRKDVRRASISGCTTPPDEGEAIGKRVNPEERKIGFWAHPKRAGLRQPLGLGSTVGGVDWWPAISTARDLEAALGRAYCFLDPTALYVGREHYEKKTEDVMAGGEKDGEELGEKGGDEEEPEKEAGQEEEVDEEEMKRWKATGWQERS